MIDPADRKKQIMFKAVAALAARERSRLGLSRKLAETFQEDGDKQIIQQVLDELEERKYLSDERYARVHVITKSSRYGDRKLQWELMRQGIDKETAEEAIRENEVSECDRAYAIWSRKFGAPPEDHKERARQVRFLASRGFSFKTIERILRCEVFEEEY